MSELLPALPTGYRARPASAEDLGAVHRLVAACEHELYGRPQTDAGGVAADFARPGLVPASDTLLVHDPDGRLAAHAWVNRRSKVDVHPGHRGRGLGAALLDWAEARARQADGGQIVQTVPDGDTAAVALLRSRGYQPMVTEWLLEFGLAEGRRPRCRNRPRASPSGRSVPAARPPSVTRAPPTGSSRTRSTSGSPGAWTTRSGPGTPSSGPPSPRRCRCWPSPETNWWARRSRWTFPTPARVPRTGRRPP
ncbi:GNAT family N-acetyltransferase [Kitasatospora aburaviensis]